MGEIHDIDKIAGLVQQSAPLQMRGSGAVRPAIVFRGSAAVSDFAPNEGAFASKIETPPYGFGCNVSVVEGKDCRKHDTSSQNNAEIERSHEKTARTTAN